MPVQRIVSENRDKMEKALEFLRGRYPEFFEAEPEWQQRDNHIAYFIGAILMRAGEVDHAHKLLDPLLLRSEAAQEAYALYLRHRSWH